jgi:hypothetical protein
VKQCDQGVAELVAPFADLTVVVEDAVHGAQRAEPAAFVEQCDGWQSAGVGRLGLFPSVMGALASTGLGRSRR